MNTENQKTSTGIEAHSSYIQVFQLTALQNWANDSYRSQDKQESDKS